MGFSLGYATPANGHYKKSLDEFYEFCRGRDCRIRCTMKKLIRWHKINLMKKDAVNRCSDC